MRCFGFTLLGCHQGSHAEETLGSEDEAKSSDSSVDQTEDWQHYQVQRQATPLEENQAWILRDVLVKTSQSICT